MTIEFNNQNITTAIIYYCYNRIEHTQKSLPKILEYRKELPLFVFCDGSKTSNDHSVVNVRSFVSEQTKNQENLQIVFRETNLGLAPNVIAGVSSVFEKGFDSVIVLEDDCVPKPSFFTFMIKSLNFYNLNDRVFHVSGFGIPLKQKVSDDFYFNPYPCSWGWGTWKNRWKDCNFYDNNAYAEILNNKDKREQFDWAGKSFSNFLNLQIEGKVNSWLIKWYVHIFNQKGFCIWATDSLLENIGFDGTGEHKVKFDRFNQKSQQQKFHFKFSNELKYNLNIINEFRQFFMGPKLIDKFKTLIYMYSGIILNPAKDLSEYYKK